MGLDGLFGYNDGENREKMAGVWIGIVTNNSDGDGTVRVKFPWRECQDEFTARVATLMAGNDRGTCFLPEVDDEVLVAFGQGNIDEAYVIGALWNGMDKIPEKNSDGKNNIRKIKSRSGHEIILDDSSEEKSEKVVIKTAAGHTIALDDSSGKEKIEIKDKSGSNSIIKNSVQNSISIESATSIKIKSQMVEIESEAAMKIKAGATLDIQGTLVKIN